MIQDRFGGFAGKIPIRVIDQVDRGRGIGLSSGLKNEFIVVGKPVGDFGSEIAGVAFLTCIRVVGKADTARFRANDRLSVPKNAAEPFCPTVEVAWDTAWIVIIG